MASLNRSLKSSKTPRLVLESASCCDAQPCTGRNILVLEGEWETTHSPPMCWAGRDAFWPFSLPRPSGLGQGSGRQPNGYTTRLAANPKRLPVTEMRLTGVTRRDKSRLYHSCRRLLAMREDSLNLNRASTALDSWTFAYSSPVQTAF